MYSSSTSLISPPRRLCLQPSSVRFRVGFYSIRFACTGLCFPAYHPSASDCTPRWSLGDSSDAPTPACISFRTKPKLERFIRSGKRAHPLTGLNNNPLPIPLPPVSPGNVELSLGLLLSGTAKSQTHLDGHRLHDWALSWGSALHHFLHCSQHVCACRQDSGPRNIYYSFISIFREAGSMCRTGSKLTDVLYRRTELYKRRTSTSATSPH
ncbi:hypothetical protein DFJ58DRAFT_357694 [Suillus subalutaceus]|uniref:uncharacterized protein n=1 Tax=Suillus subalutaceus TaxID=48586 RepID=UPI001B87044D|nr:uncharacterized protein DFJ58DRAFT_357694 [Suillus subalutaceus]KAG1826487.1 hypothetical protein DFJ58DRAFT_357694 [Suillus subalutaceus]